MPVDLEVSLAELLADLRVHAKFMSKRGPCYHVGMKKKSPVFPKPLNFQKKLERSGFYMQFLDVYILETNIKFYKEQ